MDIIATMVYPPSETDGEERNFTLEALDDLLSDFGGLAHFVCRAAYFRFENDFQGFMRESMEVFDTFYMPYFSENTINDTQYSIMRAEFEKALTDICTDITYITKSYVGNVQFTHVEAMRSLGANNSFIIVLR